MAKRLKIQIIHADAPEDPQVTELPATLTDEIERMPCPTCAEPVKVLAPPLDAAALENGAEVSCPKCGWAGRVTRRGMVTRLVGLAASENLTCPVCEFPIKVSSQLPPDAMKDGFEISCPACGWVCRGKVLKQGLMSKLLRH